MNTKIGWIGLGRMGTPMALRLISAGYPVTVYNRTKDKEEPLTSKGAKVASSPAELMRNNDVIILMVSDDQAVKETFTGKDGILSAKDISGKIIINMSTVSADISIEMAELCIKSGNQYLDAPVSGSVKPAESGELVIMAGGEADIFNKAKPILGQMGKLVIHVGNTGSSNNMKLAVNLLLGIISQGLSESAILAQKHGLRTADLLNIISNSALGNVYMKMKGEAIENDNFQPTFALKHIVKDLRLAKESGMDSPLGQRALDSFMNAEKQFAEDDIIAIYKYLNH